MDLNRNALSSFYTRRLRPWVWSLLILFAPRVVAAVDDVSQHILTLINQQQFSQAFEIAEQNQADYEGDRDFDLAYGLAAAASGHCHASLYALERVLVEMPQHHVARFTLANCYVQLGNLSAAQQEYSLLSQQSLNPSMQEAVSQASAMVEKMQNAQLPGWHGAAQLALGHDDNPNNGIEDEFITVPLLGQVRLFDQSRALSSSYYDLYAQLNYIAPLTQTSRWYTALGLNYTGYTEQLALSKSNLHAQIGYQLTWRDTDIDARVFYRPLQLDGESFLDYGGASIEVSRPFMAHSALGAEFTFAQLDYAKYDELSRDQMLLAL